MTPSINELSKDLIYWLLLEDEYKSIAKNFKRKTKERINADAVIRESRHYKKKYVRMIKKKLGGIWDLQ